MMSSYFGTSQHKVDTKWRVSVPASIRAVVKELNADNNRILITRSNRQPCLECYDQQFINQKKLEAQQRSLREAPSLEDQREYARLFSLAQGVEFDKSGRIVLPKDMAAAVGIRDECVFVGCGWYFEIWEPTRHTAEQAKLLQDLPVWDPQA